MFGITNIYAYVLGVVAVILLPGPNSIFCLTIAVKQGVKDGYKVALSILVGDGILILCSVVGAASILKSMPSLFILLKCLGALYLGYLGINMILAALRRYFKPKSITVDVTETSVYVKKPFFKGLSISLMNPKAILFFLSFFVTFVDPSYPHPVVTFLILALILQTCSFCYLSVLIFLGRKLVRWFGQHQKVSDIATACVGCLFIGFGATLLFATL
ncbi:leucine efflux protein LeuE [Neisseria sp. Ec49-e6-T10]|uniref:leucine efflux protein LeuE n=1 Tax=Neisseria sp. Ec49-e6-T10 TaxID=3140744 RepID=UPI003EBBF6BC